MSISPLLQQLTTCQKTWLESILVPKELKGPGILMKENKSLAQVHIIRKRRGGGEQERKKGHYPQKGGLYRSDAQDPPR